MIIEVKQGLLEGVTKKSILTGKEFHGFLGIPYAKPPVDDLRFQEPQPIEKWEGTLNAKNYGSPCIQQDFSGQYIGSEDCLYLNVYTPCPFKNDAAKAVMVFIHGGSFINGSGSSEMYSADYLMNYDVILVTLNYRLHILGFLNMGTKNNAGNCGLRDQCLALKWVKENIKHFGGNTDNITIFGESAGASSVHFHLIAPMSRGLFNKAIIQSDAIYSAFKDAKYSPNPGFEVGQTLGSTEKDPEKLVEFLKKQSALDLCKEATAILYKIAKNKNNMTFGSAFVPSPEIGKENPFLPDTIQNLQNTATPVPLMVGFTNQEGKLAFSMLVENLLEELKTDFTAVIKRKAEFDPSDFQSICDEIKKFYLGDKDVGEETAEQIVNLYTDYFFRYFYESFDFVTKSNFPVYIYEFSFFGKFNVVERLLVNNGPVLENGACHGDDLPYLFYPELLLPGLNEFPEPELTVIKNMCSLWSNFAKTGNPTSSYTDFEWRPSTTQKPCFARIDKDLKLVDGILREKELEFWQKLQE